MATSTSTSRIEIDTRAEPAAVFALLSDLAGYADWMSHSTAYQGTRPASGIGEGDYVDHTPLGDLTGRVVSATPGERIEFAQGTSGGALRARIVYEITRTGTGSRITRTGTITTTGSLRWMHPVLVAVIRRENRRTMGRLRAALDEDAPS